MEEFAMSGKTEQVQTRGIQLLTLANRVNVGDTELGGKKWSGKISEQAYSVWNNYQKATVEFLENNSFKLSHVGIGSANGNGLELPVKIKQDTDYTLSYGSNISEVLVYVIQMDSECNKLKETSSRNKKYTFHSEANAEWAILKFTSVLNSSYVVNNVQFEEGAVATAYEQYTYKKPTPSPDYTQPIETTPQGVITVEFTDGTTHQIVELNCPREFTKWDRLQKIDGVWNWVFRSKRRILTGSSDEKWSETAYEGKKMIISDMESGLRVGGLCEEIPIERTNNEVTGGISVIRFGNGNNDLTVFNTNKIIESEQTWEQFLAMNNLHIIYEANVSELIPLSQSEQDKLNVLTMYAPNTEITNDGGCNMELTYTVDTKAYVDAKIAEVSTVIVQKGIE